MNTKDTNTNANGEEFEELEEFSQDLIKLGKDIEERFKEKEMFELQIQEKEKEASALRSEIFQLKEKLIKINSELTKLEERRKQIGGGE